MAFLFLHPVLQICNEIDLSGRKPHNFADFEYTDPSDGYFRYTFGE